MSHDDNFLSRWSRRKTAARSRTPAAEGGAAGATPAAVPAEAGTHATTSPNQQPENAPLPPVDSLTFDSDFTGFMREGVDPELRRAAIRTLVRDPRFNVMDGLDVYIDDYSKTEPIPPEMLAGLRQAQNILQWAKEDAEERERKEREKESQLRASGEPPRAVEPPAAPAPDASDAAPAVSPESPEPPKSW